MSPKQLVLFVFCLLNFYATNTTYTIDEHLQIPNKFTSNTASKSLLCNTCGVIASLLNNTLFEDRNAFDTNVGFRLDSSGKKIRKNSQWLKIHITLEDIHCQWQNDLFKVAKRKSGLLYLASNEDIKRNKERNNEYKQNAISENRDFYFEIKPKLVKKDSKYNKRIDEMCLLITELYDEWLHFQQKKLKHMHANELKQTLNITRFCTDDLQYKKKKLCSDDMLNFKMDLSSNKKKLATSSLYNTNKIDWNRYWFILDVIFCYFIILTVLALFSIAKASPFLCKLSIIPLLLCPQYIYKKHPLFVRQSACYFVCYWYSLRFWEMFSNPQFFQEKSFVFCWFHAGAMKNMFKASVIKSRVNTQAFVTMLVHLIFVLCCFPYIFNELLPKTEVNNICSTNFYPNILSKIAQILSFIVSILYCVDHGAIFVLNMIGYDIAYDMKSPFASESVGEFWTKRWNQAVAYTMKQMIYKPVMQCTGNKSLSVMIVFIVLGIIHVLPMYLDGFEHNTLTVVFIWFVLQPLCLWIERKLIEPIVFGSHAINKIIHNLLTFAILFASFMFSLRLIC